MSEPLSTIEQFVSGFSPEALVKDYPTAAVLTGLGIGFGLGLVVSSLLAPKRESFWSDHPLGSAMSELSQTLRTVPKSTAEHLAGLLPRR